MDQSDWVKVHTIENIFEMDMIKDTLDKEGVEYQIKEYKDTAYDGLFILQKGYAALYVKKDREDEVKAIVRRIKTIPYVVHSED